MNIDGDADTGPNGLYTPAELFACVARSPKVGVPKCVCTAGKDAKPMAVNKTSKQQAREPLAVRLKPKRGKSSRKQKQRLALKLDKVRLHPSHVRAAASVPMPVTFLTHAAA